MKQIIIFFLAFISSLSAYCQVNNMEEGNQCFNQGNYSCAEAKYKEFFITAEGKDKQIAEIKLQRTKRCIENLKNANLAYNSGKYSKAKEFYLAILDSNPNDEFVTSRLESIKNILSPPIKKPSKPTTQIPETTNIQLPENPDRLNLSKTEISYRSSGGNEYIYVDTNFKSYAVDLLPSWYSVQKFDTYFVINCSINNLANIRSDFFNVTAGDKSIRVYITQEAATPVKEPIKIVENNQTKKNNSVPVEKKKSTKRYSRNFNSFSSIGFQSGEIAKYGFE